jgi:hypothetical protein
MPSAFSREDVVSGLRYTCDVPGLEESYVEYAASWSRAEYRQMGETEDAAQWLPLLQRKLTAVHLLCSDGSYLDDPAALDETGLDRVDMRVYMWFAMTPWRARMDIADQGEASRRRLFATSVAAVTTATATNGTATAAA